MIRPTDWAPLAPTDPIPGDPDAVATLSRRFARMAETIREQAQALRSICTDKTFWDSDSGRVFAEATQKTAGKLDRVFDRYATAARALDAYHPALREAQEASLVARELAVDAHARFTSAGGERAWAMNNAYAPDYQLKLQQADEAGADLDRARRKLSDAIELRDRAARASAAHLHDVIESDGLKDSGWDKFKSWVADQDWIKKVAEISSTIATWAGIAALVLACIPGLQVLAPILEAVALVATGVALLAHLTLAVAGESSWLELGVDVVSLASFGLGRTAMTGVRTGVKSVRVAAREARAARLLLNRAATLPPREVPVARVTTNVRSAWESFGAGIPRPAHALLPGSLRSLRVDLLPHPHELAAAFNPRTITRETTHAFREALSSTPYRTALDRALDIRPGIPTEIVDQWRIFEQMPVRDAPAGATRVVATQVAAWYGYTGAGVLVDQLNNHGVFNPWKPALTRGF